MGAAWKIVLVVVMVAALAAADAPPPSDGELKQQASDPVEDSPAKHAVETPGPLNPKRPPNDDGITETRSEPDRGPSGGLFDDIFNIPIKVLESVRDLINNSGNRGRRLYYAKGSVGDGEGREKKGDSAESPA